MKEPVFVIGRTVIYPNIKTYRENKVKPLSVSFYFREEAIYFRRERFFCLFNFDDDVETLIIYIVDN